MARVIGHFDLVALQEVMHPAAARRLAQIEQQVTGEPWGVITSHTVGDSSYKEGYAFIWRKSTVVYTSGAVLYLDPGNHFVREPFSAQFKARQPSNSRVFVAATVHIKYGDDRADRSPEIRALADYWTWLGQNFRGDPRLLMGDFNTPPEDPAWKQLDSKARPLLTHGASTLSKRAGQYAHLYDNIWTDGGLVVHDAGIYHYPELLGMSHKRAYRIVSDHAPVYVTIGNGRATTKALMDSSVRIKTATPPAKATTAVSSPREDCIDINTASAEQLDGLDQVGPSRSRAIIAGRPWASLDALTAIRGLDAARIATIRAQHLTCMR